MKPIEKKDVKRAGVYIRVSHAAQVDKGRSLEQQLHAIESYCEFKGLTIEKVFEDRGISGRKGADQRPGFNALLSAAQRGELDAVIVWSLSRFSRSVVTCMQSIEILREKNIQFHSLTENIDTGSANGRFFFTLLAAFAQMEAETAGERIRAVMAMKRELGEHLGHPPFGWCKSGKKLVVDQRETFIVHRILELRRLGLSYQAICDYLTENGLSNRNSPRWSKNQIFNIVKRASAS